MVQLKREVIEGRDDDWTVSATGMLVCPCGELVEDDGACPDGHESPLKGMGLI
jgi:hypothetical protein